MNTSRFASVSLIAVAALLVAGFVTSVMGSDKIPAAKAPVNSVPATVHGQPSVFNLTGTIKDPFFPKSIRTNPVIVTNMTPVAVSAADFVIRGMSGVEGQRLALINNRNFAEGESDEVTTPRGEKRKVQVLKIKEFSALIKVEGFAEPIEVFLPKDLR